MILLTNVCFLLLYIPIISWYSFFKVTRLVILHFRAIILPFHKGLLPKSNTCLVLAGSLKVGWGVPTIIVILVFDKLPKYIVQVKWLVGKHEWNKKQKSTIVWILYYIYYLLKIIFLWIFKYRLYPLLLLAQTYLK